jgi:hypothetical protein
LVGSGSMDRNPCPSKLDLKISSFDPTGNFDCRTSVIFLLAASKCGQSIFVMTPCAIGGGPAFIKSGAIKTPTTKRAVGSKTNIPEIVAAKRASIATNQMPTRFTCGSFAAVEPIANKKRLYGQSQPSPSAVSLVAIDQRVRFTERQLRRRRNAPPSDQRKSEDHRQGAFSRLTMSSAAGRALCRRGGTPRLGAAHRLGDERAASWRG